MTWEMYYARFYDWEESTQVSYMAKLESFGSSAEICEIAQAFFEEKHATRLVKKALAAGAAFCAEEVLELDGVVADKLMPELIGSIPTITGEELEELSFWLSEQEFRALAKKNHIRIDEYGLVVTPEEEALERELKEEERLAQEEREHIRAEQAAREAEDLLLAKLIIALSSKKRQERRKKRRES